MRRGSSFPAAHAPRALPAPWPRSEKNEKPALDYGCFPVKDGLEMQARGATLIRPAIARPSALCEVPSHSRQLTYALTSRILGLPFPTPSAAHLMACVLSGFQRPRLSVSAQPPLLPRQRFGVIRFSMSRTLAQQSEMGKNKNAVFANSKSIWGFARGSLCKGRRYPANFARTSQIFPQAQTRIARPAPPRRLHQRPLLPRISRRRRGPDCVQ